MRELNFKRRGVIWRLASVYGPLYEYETETDICSYWQAVLKGLLAALGFTFLGGLCGALVGDFSAWIAAMLVHGMYIKPTELAMITTVILGLVAFFGTWGALWHLKQKTGIHAPEFMSEAYTSWKEKTCVKVNLT